MAPATLAQPEPAADFTPSHGPAVERMLGYFSGVHTNASPPLKPIHDAFRSLAAFVAAGPQSIETVHAMHKLLEARDWAVTAAHAALP